uniref:Uncharacterized protein n=1 Tax=Tetraselmis chuii TaxID=63592 RepID=A0A7S1T6J1_9CHLO|mmetsp:Transcript_6799/g.12314  ORF Transcript_6799/g.12314 Transcript_6799/m.12314 type:complete len:143 (+) Transcript_6799:617-1045(+)|eukprot:CAMPEP_0177760576 /NCGR_PEP_ID=MMETSP0491_2-20121128/5338_1 /TAXON_ID=63592 /ORGANISM="Tetraselmis chuii, Strain PLY429" /LENGTH=142 /DNA_ID=CAMNT_0019276479 /DNA_START=583 /DNA_END=1011 /DNA_ORIENTATION=-
MLRSYFKQTAMGCASVATSGGVASGPEAGAGAAGAALISGKVAASSPVPVPVHRSRLPLLVIPSTGSGSLPWLPSGTPPASPSSWGTWYIEDMAARSMSSTPASSPTGSFTAESPAAEHCAPPKSKKSLDEARYLRSFESWT